MSSYKLHHAWKKTVNLVDKDGLLRNTSELTLEAFRAGMLAAADIAWPDGIVKDSYDLYDDYANGREQAAKDILMEVKDVSNE